MLQEILWMMSISKWKILLVIISPGHHK